MRPSSITPSQYYDAIQPKLQETFSKSSWVLGYGPELIARGWDPNKLLVTVEPISQLEKLSTAWELEVFLPIFGQDIDYVLAPIDFEIFLSDANYTLYGERHSQLHYFEKYIKPVAAIFESLLKQYGIPYLLDLTPSGGHVLFYVKRGSEAWKSLASIGHLEPELVGAYEFTDPSDIKRNPAAGFEAGSVFSGIGRLWNYVSLVTKKACAQMDLPVTVCDSAHKCMNLDNSWAAFPGYMRIIRSPFSLHKKNIHKYGQGSSPLCDIIQVEWDGNREIRCDDFNELTRCMWNLEKSLDHHQNYTGTIPVANQGVANLIEDRYVKSDLYMFDSNFDQTPSLHPGEALYRALNDPRLSSKSRHMVRYPNPRALQPNMLKKFIADLMSHDWSPKHIGDAINDLYCDPRHNWHEDWFKNVSRTRANFWARALGSEVLLESGYKMV